MAIGRPHGAPPNFSRYQHVTGRRLAPNVSVRTRQVLNDGWIANLSAYHPCCTCDSRVTLTGDNRIRDEVAQPARCQLLRIHFSLIDSARAKRLNFVGLRANSEIASTSKSLMCYGDLLSVGPRIAGLIGAGSSFLVMGSSA